MPQAETVDRSLWIDRFNRPTIEALREALQDSPRNLFDQMRRHILGFGELTEELAWYGDSWYWSLEYRSPQCDEPIALIVPSPEDLQVAMPMERDFAQSVPMSRMKRAVKDGLELAQDPFDTRWGIWSLTAANLLPDLKHIIKLKLKRLSDQES